MMKTYRNVFERILPRALVCLLTVTGVCACADEAKEPLPEKMPIVVEGWIEDGGHPMVIVTRAVILRGDSIDFNESVEKWCRVTVSDGNRDVILTARKNDDYMPSYVFTSTRITGKVGLTYTLTIETEDESYSATTTIPAPVTIDSLRVSRSVMNDTLYQVHAFAPIAAERGRYYKFFTWVRNREKRYYSAFLGTFEGVDYNPVTGYGVSRGNHTDFRNVLEDGKKEPFTPNYYKGDTVYVKLCTLEPEAYEFWRAYENSVSLSNNLFFNVTNGCPSNIAGAKGYWAGYGSSIRTAIVR